jgi:hypothetical protein
LGLYNSLFVNELILNAYFHNCCLTWKWIGDDLFLYSVSKVQQKGFWIRHFGAVPFLWSPTKSVAIMFEHFISFSRYNLPKYISQKQNSLIHFISCKP